MKQFSNAEPDDSMKLKEVLRTNIAGVQFSDYQTCVGIKAGSKLKLWWEPSNKFDAQAIRVEYCGTKIGYIPKGPMQQSLHSYREAGTRVYASIVSYNKTNPTWNMFVVKCEVEDKVNKQQKEVCFEH